MSDNFMIEETPEVDLNNIIIKGKRIGIDAYKLLVKASLEKIDLYPYIEDFGSDSMKLYQLYLGLKQGLDVSVYANKAYTSNAMLYIREAMYKGLDYTLFAKPELNDTQISTLINLIACGIDVSLFNKPEIKEPEMRFLGSRLQEGQDISIYFTEEGGHFCIDKMKIIRKMIDIHFDFSLVDLKLFNAQQLREIYKGALTGINFNLYINSAYSYKIMESIRETMELGIDIPEFLESYTEYDYIRKLEDLQKEVLKSFDYLERDLKFYLGEDFDNKYDESQLYFIKKAIINGYDLNVLTKENYSAEQMEELIFGLEDDLDISKYADVNLTDMEMSSIRCKLKKDKDEKEDIQSFLTKNFKSYKKKYSEKLKNLKVLELKGESLEEKTLGISKNGINYCCYIFFDNDLTKVFESKETEIPTFVEDIKNLLSEIDNLDDEELKLNIEIWANKKEE